MPTSDFIYRQLAEILADGAWSLEEIERRTRRFLGDRRKWVVGFAERLFTECGKRERPTRWRIENDRNKPITIDERASLTDDVAGCARFERDSTSSKREDS